MRLQLTPAQADLFTRIAQREGIAFTSTVKRTWVRVAFDATVHAALVHAVEISGYDMGAAPVSRTALLSKLRIATE